MSNIKRFLLVCLHLVIVESASANPLDQLVSDLTGHFSSAIQASKDSDFSNIELHITPIWKERTDGPWLYVEQAEARTPDKPYRQRLYRLAYTGNQLTSYVYEFSSDASSYVGQWRNKSPFEGLTPTVATLKNGCEVTLNVQADGHFSGGTNPKTCSSKLRGAAYATSKIELDNVTLQTWDQGFDSDGNQVWGSRKGPYLFVKQSAED